MRGEFKQAVGSYLLHGPTLERPRFRDFSESSRLLLLEFLVIGIIELLEGRDVGLISERLPTLGGELFIRGARDRPRHGNDLHFLAKFVELSAAIRLLHIH